MEELQKQLEETRSAMEKLTEEHRAKSLLSETLRRAHDEQLGRLQEAKAEIAKQMREIDAKVADISLAKEMYEGLKSNFSQKESVVNQLSLANENLKISLREKSASWEMRNKEFICALEEANAKRDEQKEMICSYRDEIDRLKGLLSLSEKKCADAENRARAPKELSLRNDMLFELEQEKGRTEEKLKWKNEQFRHLEEAHNKLQGEFRGVKKEWELERSKLFDEINTLQVNLDSKTRIADGLRSQLQMCNQALAHEESRRNLLEIRISESKALYDSVVMEYEEAKSNISSLTKRRDEEIASLRNSLATKATLLKEAEFSRTHLELENQELRESLKELQEAQIKEADASFSLKNLRLKFKSLEKAHTDCSEKLKAREAKWTTITEKLQNDVDECLVKLESKDEQILELQLELEGSCASLMHQKLESEVISVVYMGSKKELEQYCADIEERIDSLMDKNVQRGHAIADSLETRIDHQKVNDLQEDLKKALEALDQSNSAIAKKTSEVLKVECDLQQLKTLVEQKEKLRCDLEIELAKHCAESDELRRNMEVSFLTRMEAEKALMEEKDRIIEELQQQLVLSEADFSRRELEAATLAKLVVDKESSRLLKIAEDIEMKLNGVSTILDSMEQKIEKVVAEASMSREQEEAIILSLEREFTGLKTAVALELAGKQLEIDAVREALDRILTAHIIAEHEIRYKRTEIDEMEEEITMLEKQSFDLEHRICRLKDDKATKKLERDREKVQCENELKSMRKKNRVLEGQIVQLTVEREELVEVMREFSDLIGMVHQKDEELMKNLARVVKKSKNDDEIAINIEGGDFLSYPKLDGGNCIYPARDKVRHNSDRRLPLKEYNS